jgi:hypothetical protein
MLIKIVLYYRGVYYRYLYHAQSLKKSKTTCTTHIKNNNVICIIYPRVDRVKKYTVSTLYWNVTYTVNIL